MSTKQFVISDSPSLSVIAPGDRPPFNYNETAILCLSFVKDDGTAYPLEATDEFILSIDSTPRNVTDTADLMAYSDNTQVDIAGDWADISRANGKISIRVDCSRDLFESRITDADGSQDVFIQVVLEPTAQDNYSAAVGDKVIASKNVISKYH
jgi:hypothetical protein